MRRDLSAEELLGRLARHADEIRSVRAYAEMEYRGPKDKLHVNEVIVVERPDHLRIEMLSTFGVALQITTDGQMLRAYHRGDKTFYSGGATGENLARFTRLELGVRDIADLLVGLPPRRERRGPSGIAFDEEAGLWRLSSPLEGGDTLDVWLDPEDFLPKRVEEISRDGARLYTASFANHQSAGGVAVPTEIRLELPEQQAGITLRYSNVGVNQPLAASLFHFEAPEGAKRVDLDRLSESREANPVSP